MVTAAAIRSVCVKMASYTHWLNKNGALVEVSDVAKPPAKDFYQIFVTPREFVYRLWKIVPPTRPDNHPQPSEVRDSWEDFKDDERLQSEIQRVAGENMVCYLMKLAEGHLDCITRLPETVLTKIILMLDLESIAHLSMTCKHLRTLCHSEGIWEILFSIHNKQTISPELQMVVDRKGWREVFFTNKLQLQMQMRRVATPGGNAAFITEDMEEQQQRK